MYIDPGIGAMIIAGIIGALAAIPLMFKNALRKVTGCFKKSPRSETPPDK